MPFPRSRLPAAQEILALNLLSPTLAPRVKLAPRPSERKMHLFVIVQHLAWWVHATAQEMLK